MMITNRTTGEQIMINRKYQIEKYCYTQLDVKYRDYIESNPVNYTGKTFQYIGSDGKVATIRPIVTNDVGTYIVFKSRRNSIDIISYTAVLAFFHQVVLPKPDITWMIPSKDGLIYSVGNSKIKEAGKRINKTNPVAFGLPSVLSCPMAGKCREYCYAETVNGQYWQTLRNQLHNYYLIYQSLDNVAELTRLFDEMIKASKTELVRFDDFGDIIHYNELVAIVETAKINPETIIYGYTKSTGIVLNYLENGNTFPDNFRINISSTDNVDSQTYATELVRKYNIPTCYIAETKDDVRGLFRAGIPYNQNELMAIESKTDFQIILHGTFKKGTPEFTANRYALTFDKIGIETC
jgi:hypothetical protein